MNTRDLLGRAPNTRPDCRGSGDAINVPGGRPYATVMCGICQRTFSVRVPRTRDRKPVPPIAHVPRHRDAP